MTTTGMKLREALVTSLHPVQGFSWSYECHYKENERNGLAVVQLYV